MGFSELQFAPSTRPLQSRRRGYSLIEMLITVLIIQIISIGAIVSVGNVESGERTERAANETIAAIRYARMLSMSTGQNAGVEFDTAAQTIRVFLGPTAGTVVNSQMPGGVYVIDLNVQQNIKGVKIGAVSLGSDSRADNNGTPFRIVFGTMGGTGNGGSVTLTYAKASRIVAISALGEAQ